MQIKQIVASAIVVGLFSFIITSPVVAANPGFYVGGQIGASDLNQPDVTNAQLYDLNFFPFWMGTIDSNNTHTQGNIGLGGRLFAGYQFNQNWATELGYTHFHSGNISGTAQVSTTSGLFIFTPYTNTENISGKIQAAAIDWTVKGILPIQDKLSLYGKLGLALLMERMTLTEADFAGMVSMTANEARIYPTFGLGVSYDITPKVVADFSWNHIQKMGDATYLANKDLISAGLAYHFG